MSTKCPNCNVTLAKDERTLLDDLEEARIVHRNYRRGWWLLILGELVGIVLIVIGGDIAAWGAVSRVDTGGEASLLIFSGIIAFIAPPVIGVWWFRWNNMNGYDRKPSPSARLRAAERAYRNHIMDQADKA